MWTPVCTRASTLTPSSRQGRVRAAVWSRRRFPVSRPRRPSDAVLWSRHPQCLRLLRDGKARDLPHAWHRYTRKTPHPEKHIINIDKQQHDKYSVTIYEGLSTPPHLRVWNERLDEEIFQGALRLSDLRRK